MFQAETFFCEVPSLNSLNGNQSIVKQTANNYYINGHYGIVIVFTLLYLYLCFLWSHPTCQDLNPQIGLKPALHIIVNTDALCENVIAHPMTGKNLLQNGVYVTK